MKRTPITRRLRTAADEDVLVVEVPVEREGVEPGSNRRLLRWGHHAPVANAKFRRVSCRTPGLEEKEAVYAA